MKQIDLILVLHDGAYTNPETGIRYICGEQVKNSLNATPPTIRFRLTQRPHKGSTRVWIERYEHGFGWNFEKHCCSKPFYYFMEKKIREVFDPVSYRPLSYYYSITAIA